MNTLFESNNEPKPVSFFRRHRRAIGISITSLLLVFAIVTIGLYFVWPKLSFRVLGHRNALTGDQGLRNGMTVDQAIASMGESSYRLSCNEALCINEGSQQSTAGSEDCNATIARLSASALFNEFKVSSGYDSADHMRINRVVVPPPKSGQGVDLDKTACATGHLIHHTSNGNTWPETSLIYIQGPNTFRLVQFDGEGNLKEQAVLQYRGPLPEERAVNLAAFGFPGGNGGRTKAFSFPGCLATLMVAWQPQTAGSQRSDDIYFGLISSGVNRYRCSDNVDVKREEHYPGFDWPALPGDHLPSEDFLVLDSRSFSATSK